MKAHQKEYLGVKKFVSKEGDEFIFREPAMHDVLAYMDFINEVVEENAPINLDQKMSLKDVKNCIKERVDRIRDSQGTAILAEKDGEIVALCEVRRRFGRMSHVADLGIVVGKRYRRLGIGKAISLEVINISKIEGIEVIRLEAFEDNKAGISLYRSLGFVEEGILREEVKYRGIYKNCVLMSLYLRN
ncbi:MAG: GNAT family N-acetyltransferase [Halobacteriota archaeon]|nr:GNAT family N-acetyltransferase [Halobacteriota archaeon]